MNVIPYYLGLFIYKKKLRKEVTQYQNTFKAISNEPK